MRGGRSPRIPVAKAVVWAILAASVGGAAAQDRLLAGRQVTGPFNESGQALFRQLSATPGNVVFSPYSIGAAMAMALAGARGDTEREMARVLKHRLGRAEIADASGQVHGLLNSYDQSAVAPRCPPRMTLNRERCEAEPNASGGCDFPARLDGAHCIAEPRRAPSAKLLVANALMLAGVPVAEDYAALLKEKYAAEVFSGASLDTVNGWVKQKTEGKIERLLDQLSDVMLVNAVYFKARWAQTFKTTATIDEFFNLSRSRQELVPMMQQRAFHAVVERSGYRALRLPYAIQSLSMIVALPDEVDGLAAVAAKLDTAEFDAMRLALRKAPPRLVALSLPRFKAETRIDLKAEFERAGMQLAFDLHKADFSGMTGVPPAKAPAAIDQIVHRAVIEVAEESTEAAAATGIGFVVTSAAPRPVEPVRFRVDRPFLYYIVDDITDAILFQGRIVDPR